MIQLSREWKQVPRHADDEEKQAKSEGRVEMRLTVVISLFRVGGKTLDSWNFLSKSFRVLSMTIIGSE